MSNYNENYLNVSTKVYKPIGTNLKYARGVYMFTDKYLDELNRELTDSGLKLFNFYFARANHNYFKPNDNAYIADKLHWSVAKVKRIRKELKDKQYLLVLSDTGKDGTKYYRILMGTDIVNHYHTHGKLLPQPNLQPELVDV